MRSENGRAPQTRRRYWARGAAAVLLGLIVGLIIAEIALRGGAWQPPRQIVRGFGLREKDGVPIWEESLDRQNRDCAARHPERTRILFFGSSITYGVGLHAADVFTVALQARLNEARPTPGFCVLNFAQPGFSFEQKFAVARDEVARYRPALIMWEDWVEWPPYRLIGDTAYGIGDLRVRDDGFIGLTGVPDSLNRMLFLNSRLYQYVVLTFGERIESVPGGPHGVVVFANQKLVQVPALAQSVGAKLVMYLAPPLDRPFADTAVALPEWHEKLFDFAHAHAVSMVALQQELRDQDYRALRMDPCCHYNAAGHRALVPVMERIILAALAGPPAPSAASAAR